MSEWGKTKAKINTTSISTTSMKGSKWNYVQRGVERLVFLNLGRLHDYTDPCVVFWS